MPEYKGKGEYDYITKKDRIGEMLVEQIDDDGVEEEGAWKTVMKLTTRKKKSTGESWPVVVFRRYEFREGSWKHMPTYMEASPEDLTGLFNKARKRGIL